MKPENVTAVGNGLGRRLRDVAALLERYDSFVFRPGSPGAAPALPDEDVTPAARALVLRALRVATDPTGWRVLDLLRSGDMRTPDVAAALGVPRIAAWDQLDQLVQVGLVTRDLDGDRVGVTATGCAFIEIVEALTAATAREVAP